MDHLAPKMARAHNSGSVVRIVLQFFTNKEGQRDRNYINGFSLKNLIQGSLVILAQKWCILITLDHLLGFF